MAELIALGMVKMWRIRQSASKLPSKEGEGSQTKWRWAFTNTFRLPIVQSQTWKRKDALRLMDARISVVRRVQTMVPQRTVGITVVLVPSFARAIANMML